MEFKKTGFSWNLRDLEGEEKEREGEKRKNVKKSRSLGEKAREREIYSLYRESGAFEQCPLASDFV